MLKIGALVYINALPFFAPFKENRIQFSGDFSYGTPTEINGLLERSEVDIALISSASFIAHRERYILLTNLGIGATKHVKSVCLYSKTNPTKLDGKVIAIPDSSATSVMLLKVLCTHFWHCVPQFIEYHNHTRLTELLESNDAALVIGDDCLLASPAADVRVTDLCEAWHTFTNKPFVFAVFATRVEAWMQWPDEVREFHQKLSLAYDYSITNIDETISHARLKTGLSYVALREYYKTLDYYLDSSHFQGLEQFANLRQKNSPHDCIR